MIEAVEVHETQITKSVPVELINPFEVGIWMGIGFVVAPFILLFILYLFLLSDWIFSWILSWFLP